MHDFFKAVFGTIKRMPLYISCAIPKDVNLYIFGSWFGQKYADNSKAIFEYALKHSNKKCIWITKNELVYENLQKQGFPVLMQNSLKGIWTQMRAKVCFSCTGDGDFNRFLLGNCYHIELWHGVGGGKTVGLDDRTYCEYALSRKGKYYRRIESWPLRKSYMLSTSDVMEKVFQGAFNIPTENFIHAGQPRNDMFFDKAYDFRTINRNKFGGKKIILYMPTHRKSGQVRMQINQLFDLDVLNSFCRKNNILFIVKKHFYHKNEIEDFTAYDSIIDMTSELVDSNEMLMISDYLISDYSSVTADYLLLNKPIFYYCFDFQEYVKEDRTMYWDFAQISPGPKSYTFPELLMEMKQIIEDGNDDYKDERNRVRLMFYNLEAQAPASDKIIQAVENIIATRR